jgi:hypothetical protein
MFDEAREQVALACPSASHEKVVDLVFGSARYNTRKFRLSVGKTII